MANPGPFPMNPPMRGPMQPMGGPPMGGPPMGMPPSGPIRRGTSRMVPIVVSAGLAVGVFCGLLFGLGTGKKRANAEPPTASNNVKKAEEFTPESLANPNVKLPGAAAAGAGSGSGSAAAAAGSGSGSAAAEPAVMLTTLIVEISPEAASQAATVYVDGKEIVGKQLEVKLDPGTTKKKVVVQIKAPGFKDVEQDTELEGESVTLKIEMAKGRSASPSPPPPIDPAPPQTTPKPATPKPATPATPKPAKPAKPGGLIDI